MPELPEVETIRRGLTPAFTHQRISGIIIRQHKLRYPIQRELTEIVPGLQIKQISRRSKYLLFETELGHLLIHLGMSGRLHALTEQLPAAKHDHVDILFENGCCLRYHDPRRFGMILWTQDNPAQHTLLAHLGPEPLTDEFNGDYLIARAQKRLISVKQFIMDNQVVVGVGNIYANESLFQAGICPKKPAHAISTLHYHLLVDHIKTVLNKAIHAGGTTLKDFSSVEGRPGYFQQELFVYGREHQACLHCHSTIKRIVQAQRSTFYCPTCQI